MANYLDDIFSRAHELPKQTICIAAPEDKESLKAIKEAVEKQLCDPIFVGNKNKIHRLAQEISFELLNFQIIDHPDPKKAAFESVQRVSQGEADLLMKGNVQTRDLLKAVLDKECGLRSGKILSHVAIFELPKYEKLLLLTDAAMNITPGLKEKYEIIQNSIDVAVNLEITRPKVAVLAAVETVNPDMQATLDAASLSKMGDRGQIIGAVIDGPLALDNAISPEAAQQKDITSEVAGNADILLAPNIETGNVLYKSLTTLAGGRVASILAGAKAPVVLTSRADPHETKVCSIAAASMMAAKQSLQE